MNIENFSNLFQNEFSNFNDMGNMALYPDFYVEDGNYDIQREFLNKHLSNIENLLRQNLVHLIRRYLNQNFPEVNYFK